MNRTGRDIALVGAGYSQVLRNKPADPSILTLDSCTDALDNAGLRPTDVDAVFEYGFGSDSPNAAWVGRALGIPNLTAYADIMGTGPSGLAGALAAAESVASGMCETAVVYRTITQAAGHTGFREGPPPPPQPGDTFGSEFVSPYGSFALIPLMGMMMRRRFNDYGNTEEDYGYLSLNARKWAAMNERAVLRDPLTMEDYLNSRVLAEPLHLLDCDYPVSGSTSVIITTLERARELPKPPVIIEAGAFGTGLNADWVAGDDFVFGGTRVCADTLWQRTDLQPKDVDVMELYDGFTHITLSWIEALGFCGIGEGAAFIDKGRTIGPGGSLPLNTHGGQLTEGRLHGLAHLSEAVRQLRGECGLRQVPDAKVAVIANAHGPQCGAMLIRTE